MASFVDDRDLHLAHANGQAVFSWFVVQNTGFGTESADQQRKYSADPRHDPACSADRNGINS